MRTGKMPRPGLLNREQAGRLMTDTMVRIVEPDASISGHPGEYWRDNFDGYTPNIHEAGVYTAARATSGTFGSDHLYELVDPPEPPTPVDPTKPIPIRLTYQQITQNMAGIETKMCRMFYSGPEQGYIKDPYPNGYTCDPGLAQVKGVKGAIAMGGQYCEYELLDQEEALRISKLPVKMCIITEALSSALIDSLRLHPSHPVYRALVLSTLGKMPPPELTTFDEVVNWIESNCESKNKVKNYPVPPTNSLEIRLSFTETEIGTCQYTVERHGTGTWRFSANELASMAEDVENLDELVEKINETISDNAQDARDNMENSDDGPDYNNYTDTDIEDEQWEYRDGAGTRRARLMEFLQRNLSVEQQERLGITAP